MNTTLKILFFDTETTWKVADVAPLDKQPYIVQLGAIFWTYERDWTVVKEENIDLLFRSPVPIPKECVDIHWITDEMVKDKPLFSESYVKDFIQLALEADIIVWHNVEFDKKMILLEVERRYSQDSEEKKARKKLFESKLVCTMLTSVTFCWIPWPRWLKRPKLAELHRKLFDKDFDNAHNAFADIEATKDCFIELNKLWILSSLTE